MTVNRRTVVKGALAAGVASQALRIPAAVAQAGPIKVGFLTIKTGPLASGGIQMEQGLTVFFKERDNKLAGRPIELHTADTGGNPGAGAHQDPGTGRAAQRVGADRPARRLRGAGDRRLHPDVEDADPDGRGRRGHDAAQGQSVAGAAELHVGADEPSARRLRRQGPEVQARGRARRRLRLRPRMRRRLPARVRGQRRQGGAEAVHAAQRARLRHLHLAAQAEPRCRVHRPCGLERLQVHQAAARIRQPGADPRRLHAGRRIAAAADGRGRARRHDGQLVLGATRYADQQDASSPRSSATTRSIPASMRPRPICAARCSNTRSSRSAARPRTARR